MNEIGPLSVYLNLLLGGAILVGIFLIVIIFRSSQLGAARFFLSALILVLTLHLNTYLLFTSEMIKSLSFLLGWSYPGLFAIGPLFLLYCQYNFAIEKTLRPIDLLHFLPTIYIFFTQLPFYFKSASEKDAIVEYYYNTIPGIPTFMEWLVGNGFMLLTLIYLIITLTYIRKLPERQARPVVRLNMSLIAISILFLALQSGLMFQGVSMILSEMLLSILFAITMFVLCFQVLDIKVALHIPRKYKTSPVSTQDSKVIAQKVVQAIEEQKLFENPDLRMVDLSNAVNIPIHHLSQVLNDQMEISFHDLINRYRIEKAKNLLLKGEQRRISIEGIGDESGFKSKSSFYRAFRKFTGQTPSSYIKQLQKNGESF